MLAAQVQLPGRCIAPLRSELKMTGAHANANVRIHVKYVYVRVSLSPIERLDVRTRTPAPKAASHARSLKVDRTAGQSAPITQKGRQSCNFVTAEKDDWNSMSIFFCCWTARSKVRRSGFYTRSCPLQGLRFSQICNSMSSSPRF